jgi:hypothetical protein
VASEVTVDEDVDVEASTERNEVPECQSYIWVAVFHFLLSIKPDE